jgi:outer membrane protein OmpA-like peptidoglycan-associated protein
VRDEVGSTLSFGATAATLGNSLRGELDVRALVPLTKTSLGVEVLGGLRYPLAGHTFELFALAGAGIGQLPGTATFRVLAGLAFTPQPVRPEGPSGQRADALEAAPRVAEGPGDADGDGVADDEDDCRLVWGEVRWQGCPAPQSEPGPEVVDSTDYFFDTRVTFAVDEATVRPDFRSALHEVAAAFLMRPEAANLVVVGHTDSTGPAEYNQRLSVRRAEAVRTVLVEAGVEASRIDLRGFGLTQPVASNGDGTGRAMNRRVEFIFTPSSQVGTRHDPTPSRRAELHVTSSAGLRPGR